MNPDELKHAAEVMRRAADGEVVEYIQKESLVTNQWRILPKESYDHFNFRNYCYKVLDFPPPPDGCQWWNPEKLNATQVGVHEGWRLPIYGHGLPDDAQRWNGNEWMHREYYNEKAGSYGWQVDGSTWRTKSPLPSPKVDALQEECQKHWDSRLMHSHDDTFIAGWNAAAAHFTKQS